MQKNRQRRPVLQYDVKGKRNEQTLFLQKSKVVILHEISNPCGSRTRLFEVWTSLLVNITVRGNRHDSATPHYNCQHYQQRGTEHSSLMEQHSNYLMNQGAIENERHFVFVFWRLYTNIGLSVRLLYEVDQGNDDRVFRYSIQVNCKRSDFDSHWQV